MCLTCYNNRRTAGPCFYSGPAFGACDLAAWEGPCVRPRSCSVWRQLCSCAHLTHREWVQFYCGFPARRLAEERKAKLSLRGMHILRLCCVLAWRAGAGECTPRVHWRAAHPHSKKCALLSAAMRGCMEACHMPSRLLRCVALQVVWWCDERVRVWRECIEWAQRHPNLKSAAELPCFFLYICPITLLDCFFLYTAVMLVNIL